MTEHTEQTPAQPSAVPTRIDLEDFIEAVTRGVTRALAAQDEVSGYLARTGWTDTTGRPGRPPGPILAGLIAYPPTYPSSFEDLSGGQGTSVEKGLR